MDPSRDARLFRLAVALLVAVALYVAAHGDWTGDSPRFLVWWAVLAALYIAVLATAGTFGASSADVSRKDLKWALIVFSAVRVALACGEPLLSDDLYRSVWEGRVQRASGNPFAWSDRPEAAKWESLRDADVFPRINHKDYAAIYPPAWQWAMRLVTGISDSVAAVKLFLVLCEFTFWAGLWALLKARGLQHSRLLIAAASPLALVEIAGGGHNEAMGMAALVWTLVLLNRSAKSLAAVALALAVLSKLVPAILALPWLRRFRLRDYGLMVGVCLLLSAPFVDETALWSLQKYGEHWRFNETLFAIGAAVSGTHRGGVLWSGALLVIVGLILSRGALDVVRTGLIMSVAFILLTPNVLPWYALWLLVFLPAAEESPFAVAALVFTLTAPLAYLVYPAWLGGAPWRVSWFLRAIEYGLPFLAFAFAHVHREGKAAIRPLA